MKTLLKRIGLSALLLIVLFVSGISIFLLNPQWHYQHRTERGNFVLLHDQALPKGLDSLLQNAHQIVQRSPHYLPEYEITICLDDGPSFPRWVEKMKKGRAVSYAHIVVMQQAFDYERGVSDFDGHLWDLTELYAHEITHCYMYELAGFSTLWLPMWKIEGYAEYVSRAVTAPLGFAERYELLREARKLPPQDFRWIETSNGQGSPESYFEAMVYVQFLIEKKGWTYPEILESEINKAQVEQEITAWLSQN
ncbi:MAG: hypothetical protein AAFO91_14935 [Bacteroidota bacterium]